MIRRDFPLVQFFKFWIFSSVGDPVLRTIEFVTAQNNKNNVREVFVYQFADAGNIKANIKTQYLI